MNKMNETRFSSEQKKLTEKAFTQSMIISVVGILLCVIALCSVTWAWFGEDISSEPNTLEVGRFDLVLAVEDVAKEPVDVSVTSDGSQLCTLGATGEYKVTLTVTPDSNVSKGFAMLSIGEESYKTEAIYQDRNRAFTFTVKANEVPANGIDICAYAVWGSPANANLAAGGTVTIGVEVIADEKSDGGEEQTKISTEAEKRDETEESKEENQTPQT